MNKIKCEIIQDLLPLYVDDACSLASKELVNHHLNDCKSCQNELRIFKEDILPPLKEREENIKLIQPLKQLKKIRKWFYISISVIIALLIWIYMYTSVMGYPIPMTKKDTVVHWANSINQTPVLTNVEIGDYLLHVIENSYKNQENNYYEIQGYQKNPIGLYTGELTALPIKLKPNQAKVGNWKSYKVHIGYILGDNAGKLAKVRVNLFQGDDLEFDTPDGLFLIPFELSVDTGIKQIDLINHNDEVYDIYIPGQDKPKEYDTMGIDSEGNITYEKNIFDEDGNYIRSEIIPFEE